MRTPIIGLLMLFLFLIGGTASWLKQHNTSYVIHFVNYRGHTDVDKGFEASMKDRGIKTKIIYHDVARDATRFAAIRDAIRADKNANLVITWGTTTTLGIFGKHSDGAPFIKDKPGVFTLVTDPIGSEIIAKNNDGTRNITGAWHVASVEKQFTTMMIYKPAKVIGILYSPTESNSVVTIKTIASFGESFNVKMIAIPFDVVDGKVNARNAEAALDELQKAGAEWLYLPPDTYLGSQAKAIVIPGAHSRGIPTFASTEQLMEAGACVGLVSSYFELGELAAEQAEKILVKKVPPRDIDVTSVNRFQHQINEAASRQFRIHIPKGLDTEIIRTSIK